jgi:hypothetical protein
MAKSFKSRYFAALKAFDAARSAVYAAAPTNNVVLSKCREMATPDVRAAYDAAFVALHALDWEAEQSGKAYQARDNARSEFYGLATRVVHPA